MANRSTSRAVIIAAVVGFMLWFVTSLLGGRREAWDVSSYWTLGYPLALLTSGLLGYWYPVRPWRWPLALFAAQFVAMCIRNGELGNLWPVGIAFFAVLALPGIVVAKVSSRFNRASDASNA
jgi:hypothetical protein